MKKRRQHYVWKAHLKAWASDDHIWCHMNGKIFRSNLIGIAQERDFYKVERITQAEFDLMNKFIGMMGPHVQELNRGWIDTFNEGYKAIELAEKLGLMKGTLESELTEAIHNLGEEIHSSIEENALKHLKSLLNGDPSFFTDDNGRFEFSQYIATQSMRTSKMKTTVINTMISSGLADAVDPLIDMGKIWIVMSHMFATNIGWSLFSEKEKFQLILLTSSSAKLITCDQPVLNTFPSISKTEGPEKLELYYPISPNMAILITEKYGDNPPKIIDLKQDEVERYNKLMVEQTHSQTYADSKEILAEYFPNSVCVT